MMISELHQRARREIESRRNDLAGAIVDRTYEARPELSTRYGQMGRRKCLEDTIYHLRYLADAVGADSPKLFADYAAWAKALLAGYKIPADDLDLNLLTLKQELAAKLARDVAALTSDYIEIARRELAKAPGELPSFFKEGQPHDIVARAYLDRLLEGNRWEANALVQNAIQQGVSVRDVYLHVFERSQHEIGRLWQSNQLSVAQEHFCTAATQMIMSQLYPLIFRTTKRGPIMVGASIGGELHEIGLRMIADFLEMNGWDTFYLGANTPSNAIIQTIMARRAHVLAISVTMSFHVGAAAELISAVRNAPGCAQVRILAGGYPFNLDRELWRKVGADGYAENAQEAVEVAEQLWQGTK